MKLYFIRGEPQMDIPKLQRKSKYAIIGIILGVGAPVTWMMIKVIFFPTEGKTISTQLVEELFSSAVNITQYLFMGLGTSIVMGGLGFFIGKSGD